MIFRHEKATRNHPARLVLKLIANGSSITDLSQVRLRHCTWNLGSPHRKHFDPARKKLSIVVTRKHQGTVGVVQFRVVDAAGQHSTVKAHV